MQKRKLEVEAVIMTTSLTPSSPSLLAAAVLPGPLWRAVVATVTGIVAIGAYYGTWYLTEEIAADQLPVSPPEFLPGDSWVFGALALLVLVAAPMSIAFLTAVFGHSAAAPAALVSGALLMGWIVVQVVLIGFVFWLQPAMFVVGAVVFALGFAAYHPATAAAVRK